jgi:two-component system, NarL family, sensor kinase
MFTQDKEIIIAIITSSSLIFFLVVIIVAAIIKYQGRSRKYMNEVSDLRIKYQEEILKAQIEKEEQTLTRISQEIHDNIGQILSLVKLNLNTLDIEDCSSPVKDKILTSRDLVGKAIVDLRHLSKSLNSIHLSQGYLSESLRGELDIINKTGLYITRIELSGEEKPLDPQKQLIVFRIAQEAINNIIKHAKASHISIYLDYCDQLLYMIIEDDGAGFNSDFYGTPASKQSGTGLGNMENRATLIGGSFKIKSKKGEGTSVHLSIPVNSFI